MTQKKSSVVTVVPSANFSISLSYYRYICYVPLALWYPTMKGGSRRAEKSRKVLMMKMKAAKLGWAETAGQEQDWRKARAGLKHEQGRSRAGTKQGQS